MPKTGTNFSVTETSDISKVSFLNGQYIITDNGDIYYDPTTGASITDRVRIGDTSSILTQLNNKTEIQYVAELP